MSNKLPGVRVGDGRAAKRRWLDPMGIGLCRAGRAREKGVADTSAFVAVATGVSTQGDRMAKKWRIMKSSPVEVHPAARRKVRWERVSPPLAWCRDDSVDRDGQRRQ